LTWFKQRLNQIIVLRLNPFAIQSRSEFEVTKPNADLSNFSSWYRHLLQEQPAMYMTLQQYSQIIILCEDRQHEVFIITGPFYLVQRIRGMNGFVRGPLII
jgi:hypothetical protein